MGLNYEQITNWNIKHNKIENKIKQKKSGREAKEERREEGNGEMEYEPTLFLRLEADA